MHGSGEEGSTKREGRGSGGAIELVGLSMHARTHTSARYLLLALALTPHPHPSPYIPHPSPSFPSHSSTSTVTPYSSSHPHPHLPHPHPTPRSSPINHSHDRMELCSCAPPGRPSTPMPTADDDAPFASFAPVPLVSVPLSMITKVWAIA